MRRLGWVALLLAGQVVAQPLTGDAAIDECERLFDCRGPRATKANNVVNSKPSKKKSKKKARKKKSKKARRSPAPAVVPAPVQPSPPGFQWVEPPVEPDPDPVERLPSEPEGVPAEPGGLEDPPLEEGEPVVPTPG